MRDYYSDVFDNLATRLERKIENKIRDIGLKDNFIDDRKSKKVRDGLLKFGAFPMNNTYNQDFAIFGTGFGGVVVGE